MWSNVELFQAWPDTCHWTRATGHCHGRAPAPMDRIIGQIELAAKTLAKAHAYGDSSGKKFAKGPPDHRVGVDVMPEPARWHRPAEHHSACASQL